MRSSLLVLAAILGGASATAQMRQVFRGEYNAPTNHSDEGLAIAAGGTGGCYVAGSAYSAVSGTYDAHLLSIGPLGQQKWKFEERITGENEVPSRVVAGPGKFVTMVSFVNRQNDARVRVSRFDSAGNRLFTTDLSRGTSTINMEQAALAVDASGATYVGCGKNQKMYVAKLDSGGVLKWQQSIGSAMNWGETTGIALGPEGSVYATGVDGLSSGGYRTARLDPNGNIVWTHLQSGPIGNTLGPAFIKRQSNGDLVVCATPESAFGVPVYRLYKLTQAGQMAWQQDYTPDPTQDCEAGGMAIDAKDNLYVAGFQLGGGGAKEVTVKYDRDGNRLWQGNLPGAGNLADVVVDGQGRVTVAGFLNNGSATGLLISYDRNGNELAALRSPREYFTGLSVDARGSVFVVGTVFNQATNEDFVFKKYSWLFSSPRAP